MSSIRTRFLAASLAATALLLSIPASADLNTAQLSSFKAAIAQQARGAFPPLSTTNLRGVPVAEKLLTWDRLRRPDYPATFFELSDFLRANPGWPEESTLRRRAEGMIDDLTPMSARLTYFRTYPPLSGSAKYRYAQALLSASLTAAANAAAQAAWRSGGIDRSLESQFLADFGGVLSMADHIARADQLLWNDSASAAERMLPFLNGEDQKLVTARIALQRAARANNATANAQAITMVAALGDVSRKHPGLIADHSNFLRNTGNSMAARQLMAASTITPGSAANRNAWMKEVLSVARAAANDNQAQLAYDIARKHGGLAFDRPLTQYDASERDTFTSLEWLAGWTALHDLKRPRDAIKHFENFAAAAQFSGTRARGQFWAAKAAESAGLAIDANRNYQSASRFNLTFYGQLAQEKLGQSVALHDAPEPVPTPTERQAFAANPLVIAAKVFGQIGERARQSQFLNALADTATVSRRDYLVSELSKQLGRADYALIASRGELADGPPALLRFAYPQLPLSSNLEHNFVMIHAITRQESRFDPNAVSHAGARGLMQLMPPTARETAGKVGTGYRFDALTSDPNYNILLGSTYYSNLVDAWRGNHVLSIASYNAGPGNVRKWIRANGDPRLPGIDVVKWIEDIPIYETRNYVKQVLANAVVYERLRPERANMPTSNTLSAYLGDARPAKSS